VELELILVSPRLVDDDRVWRFIGPDGEFGASMADHRFRTDFITGNLNIDLKRGINLSVTVRYKEEKIDGVWVIKERLIIDVHACQIAGIPAPGKTERTAECILRRRSVQALPAECLVRRSVFAHGRADVSPPVQ